MSIQVGAKKATSKNSTVVTKEDQDKINRFARLNSRHVDLTSDMADKERELENLQVLLIVSFNKVSIEKQDFWIYVDRLKKSSGPSSFSAHISYIIIFRPNLDNKVISRLFLYKFCRTLILHSKSRSPSIKFNKKTW